MSEIHTEDEPKEKKDEVLSFKPLGRILQKDALAAEFVLMKASLKKAPTAETFARVGRSSGTHLLKMVSPRTELSQSLLRIVSQGSNERPPLVFSANASDIPYGKLIHRPLEITGSPSKSVVEHILNGDDLTGHVLDAFAEVFGKDSLEALKAAVLAPSEPITNLPAKEFPVFFLPAPGGGDIQVTSLAPASAYMGIKNEVLPFFTGRKTKDAPPAPYAPKSRQQISSKPQNISGAIGGARIRFMARMPSILSSQDAEIWKYANGGSFPLLRDDSIDVPVMRYADLLDRESEYSNKDLRDAIDRRADRLIDEAAEFVAEILSMVAERFPAAKIKAPPSPSGLLLRRRWSKNDVAKVQKALTSPHFLDRERRASGSSEQAKEA